MKMLKWVGTWVAAVFIAGCGGGGGSAGTSNFGSGSGSSGGGGSAGTTASYTMSVDVQRAAVSTSQISSTETVQAVATVTGSNGSAVEGVVVSYSQAAGSLLKFAPLAATALTNASGKATLDLSAASAANTGATTVLATAAVGSVAVAGSKSIEITAGIPSSGGSPTPAAINFIGSVPESTAIVIKGAGGNGRSESAILTFRIVDASNAPINAAIVNFVMNDSVISGAKIVPAKATSNSDGLVSVTVASGTLPTSIVVTATSEDVSAVTSQSDSLLVSNSVPVSGGFEIVAETYNLDGRKTGDATTISAYVVDQFGNPVPDGVAVSFQTDFGAVASSTLGGCATVNGICTVDFRVQDPRGLGIATVVASVRVGTGEVLDQNLEINMAGATGTPYLALNLDETDLTNLTLTSCKQSFELLMSDGNGNSTSAGTTIEAPFASTGVTATVKTGSPVLDQLAAGFPPTLFGIELDLTSATLAPACNAAGGSTGTAFFRLKFTSSGGIAFTQRVGITYPRLP